MKINISEKLGKIGLILNQNSPEILVVSGVVGVVVSSVMACKATMKLDRVFDAHRKSVALVHEKFENAPDEHAEKREITMAYAKTGAGLVMLYMPSVAIGALSITGILTGNNILRKRNIALAAAYTAIDASYKQYRGRVVERFGEEVDREMRFNGHQEQVEVVEKNEDGKVETVRKNVTVMSEGLSDYARYFAYGEAKAAEPNADYNAFFLKAQQELANHMLRAREYLFLNDVYDMLGIERSIAGQVVGWIYDKDSDRGDNYVDFGIREVWRKNSAVPGGLEKVFLLDFNVDGDILTCAKDKGLIAG